MVLAQEKLRYDNPAVELPNTRKVVKRKIKKASQPKGAKILAVVLVSVLFVSGVFIAGQYARLAMKNYGNSRVKREIASMKTENDSLQLQISELRSIGRIENIATNQLGMVKPAKYAYLEYQAEQKPNLTKVEAISPAPPQAIASDKQGSPVIEQVAQLLAGLFGTQR